VLTPSVYRAGAAVRDVVWEELVFAVPNCGYYIPHILLPSVRYNKDYPLIHLLYKALPQRCQCECGAGREVSNPRLSPIVPAPLWSPSVCAPPRAFPWGVLAAARR